MIYYDQSIMQNTSRIAKLINCSHAADSLCIVYEVIVPKVAVSNGLSSETAMYILYGPPVKEVQAMFPEFASVVL